MSAEEKYFSKGLAVPAYDITHDKFMFRYRGETHTLLQGKAGFNYHALQDGVDGFKVMPIEKVREFARAQNG